MLENGAAVNQSCANNGATALLAAAEDGHIGVVRVLLENFWSSVLAVVCQEYYSRWQNKM